MRVLLSRPDHLGDVVLTLPATAGLRRVRPGWALTSLVTEGLEDVPARCAAIDEVRSLRFPPPDHAGTPAEWWSFAHRHRDLVAGRFDAAVLLRPRDPWTGALAAGAGIPVRVGFEEPSTNGFLTHRVPPAHGRHAIDIAAAALRALAGDPVPVLVREAFRPNDGDRREAAEAVPAPERPVVIHPGVGWTLKRWPVNRWASVAGALAARHGGPVLVTGIGAERPVVEAIARNSGEAAVGLAGRLTLGGFAALLERSRLLVACDSGPVHLAALLGTPVAALYGPGDPVLAAPPSSSSRVVRIELACSPCGSMEAPPCGAAIDPACMAGIAADRVVHAAEKLLEGSARPFRARRAG